MPIHLSSITGKQVSTKAMERELVVIGIVWLMVAGICIVAANAWAMGV